MVSTDFNWLQLHMYVTAIIITTIDTLGQLKIKNKTFRKDPK